MAEPIDLREALNAVSDVIQNRPRPLRELRPDLHEGLAT
jgi:hypothetical protein